MGSDKRYLINFGLAMGAMIDLFILLDLLMINQSMHNVYIY